MENELEELAKKRVQTRLGFITHLAMYLVTNASLILIWYLTGGGYPWFVWVMFGWGIGILGHASALVIGPGSAAERRAIDRELRRLHEARS